VRTESRPYCTANTCCSCRRNVAFGWVMPCSTAESLSAPELATVVCRTMGATTSWCTIFAHLPGQWMHSAKPSKFEAIAEQSAVALVNHCLPDLGTIGALGDAYNARGQNMICTRILSCSSIRTTKNCFNCGNVHGNARCLQWISSKRSQKCDGCGKMTTRHEISAKFSWNTSRLELAHHGCLTTFHPSLQTIVRGMATCSFRWVL
jgi:hypothetical protein